LASFIIITYPTQMSRYVD